MKINLKNYCEIDKYASRAYSKLYDISENFNLGDITKIDIESLPQCDLITHGSPCQDFSIAGHGKGADAESGTRSSLMWNSVEIISHCKPKFVIWENVKNAVSKKHKHNFNKYLRKMHDLGYFSYWKILNAKNFGIPQNRERIYCISIRKDIHDLGFDFPNEIELKKNLNDMFEDNVNEKYYLSTATIKRLTESKYEQEQRLIQHTEICDTLCDRDYKDPKCVGIGILNDEKYSKMHDVSRRVHSPDGIAPTIHSCGGGNTEPKILVKTNNKKGYEEAVLGDSINFSFSNSNTRRGRVGKQIAQTIQCTNNQAVVKKSIIDDTYQSREVRKYDEISPTLRSQIVFKVEEKYNYKERIRKLTPKECWRIMGFKDKDFEKVKYNENKKQEISNSQLYKMAGNSIVVDVLIAIFKQMKKQYPEHMKEVDMISLFSGIGSFENAMGRVR